MFSLFIGRDILRVNDLWCDIQHGSTQHLLFLVRSKESDVVWKGSLQSADFFCCVDRFQPVLMG